MRDSPLSAAPENTLPQRLEAVALELFWRKGYRATSTRDIAAALGVKQGSLYYHVKNKEDILYKICYASLQHVIRSVADAASAASDPLDGMRRIVATHLRSTLEQQKQLFVSIADYRSLSPERVEEIKIFWRDYQLFVSSVLDDGKDQQVIRRDIANKYLYLVPMSTVNWTVLWFHADEVLSYDQLAPVYTEVLVEGAATEAFRRSGKLQDLGQRSLSLDFQPIGAGSNSTHARILDVASTLFARRGFSNTSIREIAEAVGVEKASLYHYLASKDELNFEISRTAHQHLCTSVQHAVTNANSPEDKLYALIVAHISSLLQHQDWHATANEQLNALDQTRRKAIVTLRDEYEAGVREIIAGAQAAGVLRDDIPPKLLGLILLGMVTHVYPWYEAGKDIGPPELGRTVASLFLSGLRA